MELDGLDGANGSIKLLESEHGTVGVRLRERLPAAIRHGIITLVGIRRSDGAGVVNGVHYDAVELDSDGGAGISSAGVAILYGEDREALGELDRDSQRTISALMERVVVPTATVMIGRRPCPAKALHLRFATVLGGVEPSD